jgi:5'-nucleotidase / UDP-sugar diphosphatase
MSRSNVSHRQTPVLNPSWWVLMGGLIALASLTPTVFTPPAVAETASAGREFEPFAPGRVDTLTILHVNDTHSCLTPHGPKDASGRGTQGGIARLAALVGEARATEPNVLFTHGGDLFVGDFMFQEYLGVPELQILKTLGMDALALGNHEFDLYPSTLESVLSTAGWPAEGFPILCANLDTSGDPVLNDFVRPYTIKQFGDLKVGILGVTTESANQESNPAPVVVRPPLDVTQAWVDVLRGEQQCNLVVVISHLGAGQDSILASSIGGIDVILGAHSHTEMAVPARVGRTLIVQAGAFYGHLSHLQLRIADRAVQGWDYRLIPIDSHVPAAPEVEALVNDLVAGVEADPRFGPVYTRTLGRVAVDLETALGAGLCADNSMGDLVADSYRDAVGTEVAFQPQGFSSQSIFAGLVTGNDVLRAVPYGFDPATGLGMKLATFRATGGAILAGIEFGLYYMPFVDSFFLHLSGMSFACDLSLPPGQRVDYASVCVNGVPLDPASVYTVAVPDGVVPFLGQIPGFVMEDLQVTDQFVYTVVRDYLVAHSPVVRFSEGRVLNTAPLSPPIEGVDALAATVRLFHANGSIFGHRADEALLLILRDTKAQLGYHNGHRHSHHSDAAAARTLDRFVRKVRIQLETRHLTPVAAERLIYLAEALRCVIRPASPAIQAVEPAAPAATAAKAGDAETVLTVSAQSPFRGQTTISYQAPSGTPVRLTIMDVNGRRVRELTDGPAGPGARTVRWDARSERGERLPAGKYFLLLRAGEQQRTLGLVLVK